MKTSAAVGIASLFLVSCVSGPIEENYYKHQNQAGDKTCNGPFGEIKSGKKIRAYNMLVTEGNEKCKSEIRVCTDGELTGSFLFPGCTQMANNSVDH